MKEQNFNEYCYQFIDFYKNLQKKNWTVESLQKQIVINIHNIKNRANKELDKFRR
ncbi:MAG: hypothetical protein RR400_03540 [Clostridia bacterium]